MAGRKPAEDDAGDNTPAEAPQSPEPRHGFVLHGQTQTTHEVEDIASVLAAYPGQYEKVPASSVDKAKLGWGDAPVPGTE